MGAINPGDQLFGFPASYPAGPISMNLTRLFTVGGTGFGTIASFSMSGYRYGDRLILRGELIVGTVTAALGWIQLPAGLYINTELNADGFMRNKAYGSWNLLTDSAVAQPIVQSGYMGVLFCDGVDKDRLYFAYRTASTGYTADNANSIFGNNFGTQFQIDIPISQWKV